MKQKHKDSQKPTPNLLLLDANKASLSNCDRCLFVSIYSQFLYFSLISNK